MGNQDTRTWVAFSIAIVAIFALFILLYAWYNNRKGGNEANINYPSFGINLPGNYSVHGIDVSHYQQHINWQKVQKMRSNGSKIQFAIIKATQGASRVDPRFQQNFLNANKTKLVVGAYHYYEPLVDAMAQVRNFTSIAKLKSGNLAPVLDIEEINGVPPQKLVANLQVFLNALEETYGVKPIIYTSANFYTSFLSPYFDSYPLWVAHYFSPQGPRINRNWQIWQHSEKGTVNSIRSKVDFNVLNDNVSLHYLTIP